MFLVFSGKKGAGKDTIAAEIIKKFPNIKFQRIGLADYLKEICINLYGLSREVCFGIDKNVPTKYLWRDMPWYSSLQHKKFANNYVTHREFLQYFGSEVCRAIDESCWVNYLISSCTDPNIIYIVTDCRFPSEIEPLNKAGAITIRLTRNVYNDNHQSETALDGFAWTCNQLLDNSNITIEQTTRLAIFQINEQIKEKGLGYEKYLLQTMPTS